MALQFTGMDHMAQLHRARSEFERRLADVRAEHLTLPTPCPQWTVRKLLAHVIGGDYAYIELLHGSSADEVRSLLANFDIGDDPLEQFQRSAAAVITAFGEPGALQRTVAHPMRNLPGSQLLSMRVTEWTIHSWDLARALDVNDSLDAELVELIYTRMAPRADSLASTGYFQPPQDVSTLLLCKTGSSICSAAPGPLHFIFEGVASAQRPGLGDFGREPCGVGDVMSRLAQIKFAV